MSNIELEKQVNELKAELATLREALDHTFRALGSGAEWHHHKHQAAGINSATLATELNKVAPQAQSAALSANDFKNMATKLGLPSMEEALRLAKKAVKTAKGE